MIDASTLEQYKAFAQRLRDGELFEEPISWPNISEQIHMAADTIDRLQIELIAAQTEAKTLQGFADLWYFAMDHAPGEFEKIVTTCQPAMWMHEIAKVRRGDR